VALKAAVERGIVEIRETVADNPVSVRDDGQGGAVVRVDNLHIGDQYEPSVSWVESVLTFQYPAADVYPHFLVPDLKRKDRNPLGDGFGQVTWNNASATQVSRRSNRMNAAFDTAAIKLTKVLQWIRSR
jgi:hypothetical protein